MVRALAVRAVAGLIGPGPLALRHRDPGERMRCRPQPLVARDAEQHGFILPALPCDGHGPPVLGRALAEAQRPKASPISAIPHGTVGPRAAPGSVRAQAAVGRFTKQSGSRPRASATVATPGTNWAPRAAIRRAWARTTWSGTGSCGGWSTGQLWRAAAADRRGVRAQRVHRFFVSAVSPAGVGKAARNA
jgi:hypothetical protein